MCGCLYVSVSLFVLLFKYERCHINKIWFDWFDQCVEKDCLQTVHLNLSESHWILWFVENLGTCYVKLFLKFSIMAWNWMKSFRMYLIHQTCITSFWTAFRDSLQDPKYFYFFVSSFDNWKAGNCASFALSLWPVPLFTPELTVTFCACGRPCLSYLDSTMLQRESQFWE